MTNSESVMGDFYIESPIHNINTLLNYFISKPVSFEPSAIITQEVEFPDVSFYQGDINYSVMRLQTDTIIVRIGQGFWDDEQFENNYLRAKKQGMLIGGYWFYDDRVSPKEQAELLITLLMGKKLELEVYIDWETSFGGQFKDLRDVVAMMDLIEKANELGLIDIKGVGLYTGYYFFIGHSNPVKHASQYAYLKSRPLWLAWYAMASVVKIPAPWSKLNLWQWGTPSVDWGQETKEIDMNWFNGTKAEFKERYGNVGGQEPMADYMELKSTSSVGRSVREQTDYPQVPHIIGTNKGSLLAGKVAKALPSDNYVYTSDVAYNGMIQARAGDKWWKVYEVNGVSNLGWIAEKHLGQILLDTRLVQEPTSPSHIVEVVIDGVVVFKTELP